MMVLPKTEGHGGRPQTTKSYRKTAVMIPARILADLQSRRRIIRRSLWSRGVTLEPLSDVVTEVLRADRADGEP
jgi:hypothetical protein